MNEVLINSIPVGSKNPLVFIMGPCVIEGRDHALFMAENLKKIAENKSIPLIYKSSYDKANRTSIYSYRGPGLEEGLKTLYEVKEKFDLPIITDIHEPWQADVVAKVIDVIQIPAFLCRQTDLLLAAGKTGKVVNVKKGQFISPYNARYIAEKIESTGNKSILLTERGYSFGYNGLVFDICSIPIMQETGYPVIFDATHSVQTLGKETTGGKRDYIKYMARAAVVAGCDGIFLEVHNDVKNAKSDKDTQYPLSEIAKLIDELKVLSKTVREIE
jgi:2-dehydro-3-deoxyphosphooctonate aldolase (KDO 8-P synthase)